MADLSWLDEIEAAEKEATPAPWEYDGMHPEITTPHGRNYWLIVSECRSAPDQVAKEDSLGHYEDGNFQLISALRNAAPRLLKIARAAQAVALAFDADETRYVTMVNLLKELRAAIEGEEIDRMRGVRL